MSSFILVFTIAAVYRQCLTLLIGCDKRQSVGRHDLLQLCAEMFPVHLRHTRLIVWSAWKTRPFYQKDEGCLTVISLNDF